ncbi:MAG TPA: hypothetical protein VFV84_09425 [Burkholderiales bacterium]|nr:hypothetical protein [Burkholderiales bacterium]
MRRLAPAALAALLTGCTTTYGLTLMPRNSGKLYQGEATGQTGGDMKVSVTIDDRVYHGNWVVADPPPSTGFVIGGAFGGRGPAIGTSVVIDDRAGTEAKALLRAEDGSGLRCDFHGVQGVSGTGNCYDDSGLTYDVQLRRK